jgi:hypothetical protein
MEWVVLFSNTMARESTMGKVSVRRKKIKGFPMFFCNPFVLIPNPNPSPACPCAREPISCCWESKSDEKGKNWWETKVTKFYLEDPNGGV